MNAVLNALESAVGTSAVMKIRTGAVPSNVAAADTGSVLASLSLPSDWLANAASGVKAKAGTWTGTASGTGTAGHWRIYASDGATAHVQGTISEDLVLSSNAITSGQTVTITDFVINYGGLNPPVIYMTSVPGLAPMSWVGTYTDIDPDDTYNTLRWRVDGGSWVEHTPRLFTSADAIAFALDPDNFGFDWTEFETASGDFAEGELIEVQEGVSPNADGSDAEWGNILSSYNFGVVVQEGDSITAWGDGFADMFVADYPEFTYQQPASGGAGLSTLEARSTTSRSYNSCIMTVLLGANVVSGLVDATETEAWFEDYMDYIADFRADGDLVLVCHVTPASLAYFGGNTTAWNRHNTNRATLNALLDAEVALPISERRIDAVCTWIGSGMEADSDANTATKYPDGLHPGTSTSSPVSDGHERLYPFYRDALLSLMGTTADSVGGISDLTATAQSDTEVLLEWTPATNATSHEYRVDGGSWVACDDNSGSQVVDSLTAETEYDFQVRGLSVDDTGPASNTATETTEATPAGETASSWATSTGANKSTWVTVNGTGNLAATGTAGFASAPTSVRASQPRNTGKRQFEYVITNRSSYPVYIGVDDGTDYLGDGGTTNYTRPGKDNSTGVSLKFSNPSTTWQICYGGAVQESGTVGGGVNNVEALACEFDPSAGTVKFFSRQASVWSQVGTTVTGQSFSNWYANCGFEADDTATAKFITGQSHTLGSGVVPYDN